MSGFFEVGKIKIQLNLFETQIKNLCANEPEYIKKLLDDPASALLQAGIDVKNVPIRVRISTTGSPFIRSILVNFFVGAGSYRNVNQSHALPDLIPGPIIEANREYVSEAFGIQREATKTIAFEGYGIKNKKMLGPNEAKKVMYEEKAKRDEKSGKALLESECFKSAFLSFSDTVGYEKGQCIKLEKFGFDVIQNSKTVHIKQNEFDPPVNLGRVSADWEQLSELFVCDETFSNFGGEVACKILGSTRVFSPSLDSLKEMLKQQEQIRFGIETNYTIDFHQDTQPLAQIYAFLSTHKGGLFKFNDFETGVFQDKYYEETRGRCNIVFSDRNLSSTSIANVKKFVIAYQEKSI